MMARVADSMKMNVFTDSYSRLQNGVEKVSVQLSSGRKINASSDDPSGTKLVLSLMGKTAAIEGYRENISSAGTWVKMTAETLTAVDQGLEEARHIVQTAVSATAEDRSVMADSIQYISDQMLAFANSKVNERYLFSGSLTEVVPFVAGAGTAHYDYKGNDDAMLINIGKDLTAAYNVPGDAAFQPVGGVDLFLALKDIKTALLADDSDAIILALDTLTRAKSQVQGCIDEASLMSSNLGVADARLVEQANSNTKQIEGIENADTSELAMDFQMQTLALNASYDAAFRISELSLLNFLK
jgi:flagellar hook-associated protein 3 FlgL